MSAEELILSNCGAVRRLWRVPWTARRSTVNPTRNQSWIFIGRIDVEAEAPILWPPDMNNWLIRKDPDAGKGWRQKGKEVTDAQMVGWYCWLNRHEFEQTPGGSEGQGSLACCAPRGRKGSDTTEQLDNNNKYIIHLVHKFSLLLFQQNQYVK